MSARRRDSLSSLLFVLVALVVSSFALSIVSSGGAVLSDWAILPPAACVALLAALSSRFPRTVGFPVIVGLGAAVAIMGYCFFSLPPMKEGAAIGTVFFGPKDAVSVRFGGTGGSSRQVEVGASIVRPVHAEVLVVHFNTYWPVFGGRYRGALRSISLGSGTSLKPSQVLPIDFLFPADGVADPSRVVFWGIRLDKISGDFAPQSVAVGERIGIYLRESSIRFIP